MKANEDNLFSVSYWEDYELVKATAIPGRQETQLANGLLSGHAYGVIEVREFKDRNLRLLKIRNPWGNYNCLSTVLYSFPRAFIDYIIFSF